MRVRLLSEYLEMFITNGIALMIDIKASSGILLAQRRRVLILYVGRRKREQQIQENRLTTN